jgi:CTP synthase
VGLHDAYLSVAESRCHAGLANDVKVDIKWVNSEEVTPETVDEILEGVGGVLVPGGFGDRGIAGMIEAVRYSRVNNIPFFGVCLGMQMAVIEFARNVIGIADADSGEFTPEGQHSVIDLMPEQKEVTEKGGTMRLGLYPCKLRENSLCQAIYNDELIYERHRHRFEFGNEYRKDFEKAGIVLSGLSPDERLVEIIELPAHPWFVGVQFHPEFKSRPNRAHPLFASFIKASVECSGKRNKAK